MTIKVQIKSFTAKKQKTDRSILLAFRPGTTDEPVLKEVLTACCYRKVRSGFEVCPGEHWLDLGANIGAFAAYCYLNGATADCYEPDSQCFTILQKNIGKLPGFSLHQTAVTHLPHKTLPFYKGTKPTDHYRATILPTRTKHPAGSLPNRHGQFLTQLTYDGVKMDIEGSEFGLIEAGYIPQCKKLVLEYHFSRDKGSMTNFHQRMDMLRQMFKEVSYSPTMDKPMLNDKWYSPFDQFIYCFHRLPSLST